VPALLDGYEARFQSDDYKKNFTGIDQAMASAR
jgi:hypothetical protein